ncbi:MT-A70-domain-containing protein [Rhizophagus diaphanus]|nr:MT-A70-domain-containing protein [Rhizophagus diaphanus] [Rhizophagus sp. MUCL 43196]
MSKNETLTSPITANNETCFAYPFEAGCTTNHSSNNLSKDSSLDARLIILLEKETELKLQIDELIEEITNLEAITKNRSRSNGVNEEDKETKKNELKKEIAEEICWEDFEAPEWCVPIKADVLTFEWDEFAKECQFDVILMDPPWQLATHAPTRGVAIAYQQLPDVCIEELPIPKLQKNGFLFIWVINNKYSKAFEMMKKWGYTYCDDITWVKQTVNRRMAKGHGFYLQHAKETCLMGRKGEDPPGCNHSISSDVIFSERRGQSQKPEELYEMIEELVPNGNYLEIFGRKNNLRDYWVTIGNEL